MARLACSANGAIASRTRSSGQIGSSENHVRLPFGRPGLPPQRRRVVPDSGRGTSPPSTADPGELGQPGDREPDVGESRPRQVGIGKRRDRADLRPRELPSLEIPPRCLLPGNRHHSKPSCATRRPYRWRSHCGSAGGPQRDLLGGDRGDEHLERIGEQRRPEPGRARRYIGTGGSNPSTSKRIPVGAPAPPRRRRAGSPPCVEPSAVIRTASPERSTRCRPPSASGWRGRPRTAESGRSNARSRSQGETFFLKKKKKKKKK